MSFVPRKADKPNLSLSLSLPLSVCLSVCLSLCLPSVTHLALVSCLTCWTVGLMTLFWPSLLAPCCPCRDHRTPSTASQHRLLFAPAPYIFRSVEYYHKHSEMRDRKPGIVNDSLCGKINQSHNDVIKWKHFRVTGHLCGEFTGHRWNPHTKASDAGLVRSVQNTGSCYPGQGWFVRNLGWGLS